MFNLKYLLIKKLKYINYFNNNVHTVEEDVDKEKDIDNSKSTTDDNNDDNNTINSIMYTSDKNEVKHKDNNQMREKKFVKSVEKIILFY